LHPSWARALEAGIAGLSPKSGGMLKARWICCAVLTAGMAVAVPPAHADVERTVEAGESLSSIAAAEGLGLEALASANGLPWDADLLAGSTIVIPGGSQSSGAETGGSYTVSAGDTLSAIAANAGLSTDELAAANGLDADSPLLSGTSLTVPGGGGGSSSGGGPVATPGSVTEGDIGEIAAEQNVPASLATAVAWQESGFENGLVSSADARGVMQILPGTWDFIQDSLASRPLDPSAPLDNVAAGVSYLGYLLDEAGGDPATAVAGYYQGLGSVRERGFFDDTNEYVDSVLSLADDFAGG
jgi:N-acetylmuramoyl-L-alanine amidase